MRKEALSDLGKTTLANEVKILRKLQKAGLPYQVLGNPIKASNFRYASARFRQFTGCRHPPHERRS